jgi:hypothetical protein
MCSEKISLAKFTIASIYTALTPYDAAMAASYMLYKLR